MFARALFAGSGRGRAKEIVFSVLFYGVILFGSPILAQSDSEGVPPWQLPPTKNSQLHKPPVQQTSYQQEGDFVSDSGENRRGRAASRSMRSDPEMVGDNPYFGESDECSSCGDSGDECGEDLSCLNPFRNHVWVRGEFLAMSGKSASLPALVTTSSAADLGVLGRPTTEVLFGGRNEGVEFFPGVRATLGYRFHPCEDTGLEVSYMFLTNNAVHFDADSSNTPVLARPFYNVQTPAQASLVIAEPTSQTGNVHIRLNNEFDTLELLWRQSMIMKSGRQVDFLAGYRYAHFTEDLTIDSTTNRFILPVSTARIIDRFSAINDFQGGELGISTKKRYRCWTVELLGKFALGNTRSTVNMSGSTNIDGTTTNRGLLSPPVNVSRVEENNLTVIPELGITLGYDVTERLQAKVGYTFLYWSRVARPGDQIDTSLNNGNLSTAVPAPVFRYMPGDYWVQGLTAGFEYRF